MFTWERWVNSEIEVYVATPDEARDFLCMVIAKGYYVQAEIKDYLRYVGPNGAFIYAITGYYGPRTYIHDNTVRARDVIMFKNLHFVYNFPSKSTLMDFLCEG